MQTIWLTVKSGSRLPNDFIVRKHTIVVINMTACVIGLCVNTYLLMGIVV